MQHASSGVLLYRYFGVRNDKALGRDDKHRSKTRFEERIVIY